MILTRRTALKVTGAGGALATLAALGAGSASATEAEIAAAQQACRDFLLGPGGRKPVALTGMGVMDPAAHAKNDVLFWSDQLAEHGLFLAMLLPGQEAADLRNASLDFQQRFTQHLQAVQRASVDQSNYRDVNRQTSEMVKPFVDFKLSLEEALRTGRVRGLVYPTFANHIAAEGNHFLMRLENLSRGNVEFDLSELVPFWSKIMAEHALFAAHLLDPTEMTLIEQARAMASTFQTLASNNDVAGLVAASELIIGFKETAETGIERAQIQSIIHPALADHIRREALKFRDEIVRTVGVAGAAGARPAPAQVPRRP